MTQFFSQITIIYGNLWCRDWINENHGMGANIDFTASIFKGQLNHSSHAEIPSLKTKCVAIKDYNTDKNFAQINTSILDMNCSMAQRTDNNFYALTICTI